MPKEDSPERNSDKRLLLQGAQRQIQMIGKSRGPMFKGDAPRFVPGLTLDIMAKNALDVLDVNCKAHELDNLYIVDTSFFVSIGAVNPSLTAMGNAMRVGDHLPKRLG